MSLSVETISKELSGLFRVPPDDSRWNTTSLIDLPLVRRVAVDLGLPASQSSKALAIGLLHVTAHRITPAGPEAPADLWKTMVAAELNFLAAVRSFVAGTLLDYEDTRIPFELLKEASQSSTYSPDEFGRLASAQKERVLSRIIRLLWVWKTLEPAAFDVAQEAWQPLLGELARDSVFTRDVIYERRSRFRERLAENLHAGQRGQTEVDVWPIVSRAAAPAGVVSERVTPSIGRLRPALDRAVDAGTTCKDEPAPGLPATADLGAWTAWVNERLRAAAADLGSMVIGEDARRLAQNLALVRLDIDPTSERTCRLTGHNVRVAHGRSGFESDTSRELPRLLELLLGAGLLRQDDGCIDFVHASVPQLMAAERICEHDVHWVSLHPRYAQVMRWAATILARRGEDSRTAEFFIDLERAVGAVSPLGWLDIADCLVIFGDRHWPGAVRVLPILMGCMEELVHPACVRLQRAIGNRAGRLAISLNLTPDCTEPDELISSESFAAIRQSASLAHLVPEDGRYSAHDVVRPTSMRAVCTLLDGLQEAPSNLVRTQRAAWLQIADLSACVAVAPFAVIRGRTPLRTGLEELALIALNTSMPRVTRQLAQSVLANDERLTQLWQLGLDYAPLVCELELATGTRLWWDPGKQCWIVVQSDKL